MITGHGNNPYEYADTIRLDFSSNIAFNHKSAELLEYLQSRLACINNYPDPNATALTQKIAAHHGVNSPSVLVTNGSAEAFYLVAHFLAGAKTAICIPSFAEYEDACKLYKHDLDFIPLSEFIDYDFTHYQSVWLGNPNNPNGVITPIENIVAQCLKNPHTHFIVDQAYAQLTSQKNVNLLVKDLPKNLIVIHSLTKEFAIPGLRLGYITASSQIIHSLSTMRPPWSVNALSLEAGLFIMEQYNRLLPSLSELLGASLFLQKELAKIAYIDVIPSSCNFFLCKLSKDTAAMLKQRLVQEYGILIRDASNFQGLNASYFRVAAQSHAKNLELIEAMQNIVPSL